MYDTQRTTEQILSMLAAAPGRIANLSEGAPAALLHMPPEAEEWSARDVLARMCACCDMWGKSIALILREDRPTFKAVNPLTWIKQTDYLEQEFHPSLRAFTLQRAELVEGLKPLGTAAWSRAATVTGAGKPLQRTVYTYALWLAKHELQHLRQIERIVSALQQVKIAAEVGG